MRAARRRFRGYTLIESVVALAVIAIMGAVMIVGAQTTDEASAQTVANGHLQRIAAAQQSFAANWGTYTDWATDLDRVGHDLDVINGESTEPGEISVALGTSGALGMATVTKFGDCVMKRIAALVDGGETTDVTPGVGDPCLGSEALSVADTPQSPQSRQS